PRSPGASATSPVATAPPAARSPRRTPRAGTDAQLLAPNRARRPPGRPGGLRRRRTARPDRAAEPCDRTARPVRPRPTRPGELGCALVRESAAVSLLGASDVRALADRLGVRPTKTLGQNFVHD